MQHLSLHLSKSDMETEHLRCEQEGRDLSGMDRRTVPGRLLEQIPAKCRVADAIADVLDLQEVDVDRALPASWVDAIHDGPHTGVASYHTVKVAYITRDGLARVAQAQS